MSYEKKRTDWRNAMQQARRKYPTKSLERRTKVAGGIISKRKD